MTVRGAVMKDSAIRRLMIGCAVLLGMLTSGPCGGNAFAVAFQPPPPSKPERPAMTAPAALHAIRDGLNNAGIRGGDERFRHHYENISVTMTGFSYTEVDDVARWATQPRSRSFPYNEIPAFSVEFHSPFLPNAPTGYRTTSLPRIWWGKDKVAYARRFVDAVDFYDRAFRSCLCGPRGSSTRPCCTENSGCTGKPCST